jgi:hypothetical protein
MDRLSKVALVDDLLINVHMQQLQLNQHTWIIQPLLCSYDHCAWCGHHVADARRLRHACAACLQELGDAELLLTRDR